MSVCLTFDLDWAPDFVLEDLRQLLLPHHLPSTVFCTHESPAVRALISAPEYETAIHPNFLVDRPPELVLSESLARFPAKGVRNHVLYFHSRLLPLFHRQGIEYFSNDLLFLQPGLRPFFDWSGLLRLPIYWQDDVHCIYYRDQFRPELLHLGQPGLKVLNFHPIHVFLNTRNFNDYGAAKPDQNDPDRLRRHRNSGPGIRTLLCELLESGALSESQQLGAVGTEFARENRYAGNYAEFLKQ